VPLSTRELFLVLRARDETSRVLRNVSSNISGLSRAQAAAARRTMAHGQAMTTMGVGVAAAGVAAINVLEDMAMAAVDYNNQAAKTLTQTDGFKTSVEQLKKVSNQVAAEVPAPFEQLQTALYDIFSSTSVNVKGAQKMLHQFARDAVGGAVSVDAAGRGVIEVMNAWHMKVSDVSHISDVMFQLVRKGVGTYEQFNNVLGRAIPSAVKAGQSVETLSGMMAFLTRNGLSAAMAAASSARALDALSNPKTIENFKNMGNIAKATIEKAFGKDTVKKLEQNGVNFKKMSQDMLDSHGKMKPITQIMHELNHNLDGLSKPQKAAVMSNLFKGSGGTIQAMRFFNLGLNDSNGLLDDMVGSMNHAKGAAKTAYNIMSQTPAAKIQGLKNQWMILKTTVGNDLQPVLMKLVDAGTAILKAWQKLDPATQGLIVKGTLIAAVLAVVLGVVVSLAGIFLMASAALTVAEIAFSEIAIPIAIVMGAIIGLGIAVYEIIKHWDGLKGALSTAKGVITDVAKNGFKVLADAAGWLWDKIKAFADWFWTTFGPGLITAWNNIKTAGLQAWDVIKKAVVDAWAQIQPALAAIVPVLQQAWQAFQVLWQVVGPIMKVLLEVIVGLFIVSVVKDVLGPLIKFVGSVVTGIVNWIKNLVGLVSALINNDWKGAWDFAKRLVFQTFHDVVDIVGRAALLLWGIVKGIVMGVINFFKSLYDSLVGHSIIPDMVRAIISWWNKLVALVDKARQIFVDVVAKVKQGADNIIKKIQDLVQRAKDAFNKANTWLVNGGRDLIDGLKNGISDALKGISSWIKNNVVDPIVNAVKSHFGIHSPSTVFAGFGGNMIAGLMRGLMSTSPSAIVKKVFGTFPKALGALVDKGMVSITSLPAKVLGSLGIANFSGALGKISNAAGAAGIRAVAAANGAPANHHIDPQGGNAYDIMSSGAKNSKIAEIMRKFHAQFGLRYVISQMRIASARSNWNWRPYTPITNQGDFRHVGHVHVSYANGGWINEHVVGQGQRSGRYYQFGEKGRELVVPEGATRSTGGVEQHFHITTQEINPVKHAADLGWMLASRTDG
jgi:TP901 family phage tail tape measure protein